MHDQQSETEPTSVKLPISFSSRWIRMSIPTISRAWFYVLVISLSILILLCPFTVRADDDWGQLSARLSPRMTEGQVMGVIGYRPNKVELQTCGGGSPGGPWQCKIFTFGSVYNHLTVWFFEDNSADTWRVNNWSVFP
jgi:hypothetical protein